MKSNNKPTKAQASKLMRFYNYHSDRHQGRVLWAELEDEELRIGCEGNTTAKSTESWSEAQEWVVAAFNGVDILTH